MAAKAGQYDRARYRLLDVVERDQANEAAWFWLYHVFERIDDKRTCLENLVLLNPRNQWARAELLNYLAPPAGAPPQPAAPPQKASSPPKLAAKAKPLPITLKLVAAFWLGISIILLAGGIIGAGEWLVFGIRSETFRNYLTILQLFELLVSISLVVAGVVGINVAIGLYSRSMIGFYGSIIFALGLLLAGPVASLIASPPNYLALVCTGGISGTIVFLTLASQSGFEDNQ